MKTIKLESYSRTVKSISQKSFDIALLERPNGHYYVQYRRVGTLFNHLTYDIRDYGLASIAFDMILTNLEWNYLD